MRSALIRRFPALVVAALIVASAPVLAQSVVDDLVSIDESKVDFDFFVQGEYVGDLEIDDETVPVGVQLRALGKGKFDGFGYAGGLPGAGWDRSPKQKITGQSRGPVTHLTVKTDDLDLTGTIEYQDLTVRDPDGRVLGKLERIERRSPTLGLKPPAGAVVLFDGKSADKFKKHGKGGMDEQGRLRQGQESVRHFGSGKLHLEFLLPYMPQRDGQARGNSGVYMQGRFEAQMLDSFAKEVNWSRCGGLYSIRPPDFNMCFPPLRWQTYDIDFVEAKWDETGKKKIAPARMTVRLNGVLIQDDVALNKGWTTAAINRTDTPEPGPVYLQDHGCPVRYRNIWFVPE